MKLSKIQYGPWTFKPVGMIRERDATILLNFEGHGAEDGDTVEKLIARLQKLDPKMTVMVFEDDNTGRMGLFISGDEIRTPTHEECLAEKVRAADELAAAERLAEARKRSDPIIAELKRRGKVEELTRALNPVQLAILQVESDMGAETDPVSLEDLQADMKTLRDEETRLQELLAHYQKPVTVSS